MAIVILGMHRSGTSALTALIGSMSAWLGAPKDLLPADSANQDGYFERNDILAANRTLMQHHGCNWYDVANFDAPVSPMPPPFYAKLRNIIGRLEPRAPFAVKDPRFCFTLPYWRKAIPNPVIVLALRHPAAIADSLKLRNQMPHEQGLALWEAYMSHALQNIEGLPIVRVMYEEMCENPALQSQLLYSQLSAYFPELDMPDHNIIKPSLTRAHNDEIELTDAQQILFERALGH